MARAQGSAARKNNVPSLTRPRRDVQVFTRRQARWPDDILGTVIMSDVRSMLRGERASRKVKHSQAAYTSTGQLMCSVCRCPVKSAAQWETHLQSEGHLALVQKIKSIRHATPDKDGGDKKRKRKADPDDGASAKRLRNLSSPTLDTSSLPASDPLTSPPPTSATSENLPNRSIKQKRPERPAATPADDGVDEEEWAAFEREMKEAEDAEKQKSFEKASAEGREKPLTAQEQATKAIEEESIQRDKRQEAAKDEADDAEVEAEDELSTMASLDKRMQDWRAKREAMAVSKSAPADPSAGGSSVAEDVEKTTSDPSEDEDESEDDGWKGLGGL